MLILSPDGDVHLTTGAGSATAMHVRKTSSPSMTSFMFGVTYSMCGTVQANELSGISTMYPRDGVQHFAFNPCLLGFRLFSQLRYQRSSQLQCSMFPLIMNVPIWSSKGRSDSCIDCIRFDCMFSDVSWVTYLKDSPVIALMLLLLKSISRRALELGRSSEEIAVRDMSTKRRYCTFESEV